MQQKSHKGCISQKGFTLIELLVVVLIIAILAAIALPQYQKAVLKSRYSGLMPIASAVANGQEIYYMDKGNYARNITELDIKAPSGGANANIEVNDGTDERFEYVLATKDDLPGLAYVIYQKHSEQFPDTVMCEANEELNEKAPWLCKEALKGEEVTTGSLLGEGWTAYIIKGTDESGSFEEPSGCTGNAPTIRAGKSGAVSTAECVNGEWKFVTWNNGEVYTAHGTTCTGDEEYACAGSTFRGSNSQCEGKAPYACAGTIMVGSAAHCKAYVENGCAGAVYSPGADYATNGCYGFVEKGCSGSVFGKGTYCVAYTEKGCAGAIMKDGGHCQIGWGGNGNCAGAIIQDGGYCTGAGCEQAEYSGTGCCAKCTPGSGVPKCIQAGSPFYYAGWDGEYW